MLLLFLFLALIAPQFHFLNYKIGLVRESKPSEIVAVFIYIFCFVSSQYLFVSSLALANCEATELQLFYTLSVFS